MKRKLLFIAIYYVFFVGKTFGQDAVTATWSLLTDGSVSVTGAGASSITGANQVLGAGITSVTYAQTYDVDNVPTNQNWQKSDVKSAESSFDAAKTANFYTEYKLTTVAGKFLQVNNVTLSVVGIGGTTNRLVAEYSLDGFTTRSFLTTTNATYRNDGVTTTPYAANDTDPVALLNVGNTSSADLQGREILTFANLAINVAPTQTLSIRFYYFQTGTGNRFVANKNIIISGRTASDLNTLPLDFLSFKAKLNTYLNSSVKLDWSTTNEVNTQKFIVERSANANFSSLGEISTKNNPGVHNYTFTDFSPLSGTSYYRLKQVDLNGDFKYSDVVSVKNESEIKLTAYPLPATNTLNVSHSKASKEAIFNVFDIDGRKLKSFNAQLESTLTSFDISDLKPGNFILVFDNNGEVSTTKILKR